MLDSGRNLRLHCHPGEGGQLIPAARQRVLVRDRAGLYFVLTVYQESGCADLVELESATLVEGVQFDKILPLSPPEIEPDEVQSVPDATQQRIRGL